jgi:hypothetical protein
VEVAFFEELLAQADGGVVGVGEEGVLDDDAGAATGFQNPDEVLEEEVSGLAGADGEVLLNFGPFLAAEGRIGPDDAVAILSLNVGKVFGERVGVDDVRGLDPNEVMAPAPPRSIAVCRVSRVAGFIYNHHVHQFEISYRLIGRNLMLAVSSGNGFVTGKW